MSQERPRFEETVPRQAKGWPPRIRTFSSLQSRDFRLLWIGNIFNYMALWLQLITLGWLVWFLTGSAVLSATAAGLRTLPFLVVGPWAGVVADRMDRRKLVIVFQALMAIPAFLFAFVVASGAVEPWHVFAYAIVSALIDAVVQPARQALMVNTVHLSGLSNAFALNAMAVTANRLVGALLGGLLITTVGIKWNFFVEGGAYLAAALLLIPMGTPFQEASTARHISVFSGLKAGFGYIWRDNRIILHLIVLNLILILVFLPIPNLLPAYTGEVLHSGAEVGGFLLAAQGAGGLTATFVIASLGFFIGKGRVALITLVVGSAAILMLAQSHWLLLSLAMMALLGFSQTNFIVSNQTMIQSMVPDTLRGRVTSIYMLEHGLVPLAIFLLSLLMEIYTVPGALTVVAAASIGLSLYALFAFRRVRQLE